MNIKDLQYLVALADTGHFGRAAERCFVSQPTLSTQLKKLEDYLGVSLVERTNKSVMLTPVGEKIVTESRVILADVERIKNLARQASEPLAGPFRLGIIPTLGPYLLPHMISQVKARLPKLELIVTENKTKTILEQLRLGELDAVILALPVNAEQLEVKELFQEPFYLAAAKTSPLAATANITMATIEKENVLLLEEGHCLRDQALEACQFSLSQQASQFSATSLETLRQIVALGSGVTLLPALAALSAKQDKNIVVKPIAGATPTRSVGMLWRKSSVLTESAEAIAKLIVERVSAIPEVSQVGKKKVLSERLG